MNTKQFIKLKNISRWAVVFALFGALLLSGTVFAESEMPPEEPDAAAPAASEPPAEAPTAPAQEPSAPAEPAAEPSAETPAEAPAEGQSATSEVPVVEAPVVDAPAEEAPIAEEPLVEAPAAEAPVADAPVGETPLEEAPVVETPVELAPGAETLEPVLEAPAVEAVDIQLVDETGEVLDMASQESAEVLASGDPYFSYGGHTFAFVEFQYQCPADAYDCNYGNSNPIQAAIEFLRYNNWIPTDRKIYVEAGDYDGNVTIDSYCEDEFDPCYWTDYNLIGLIGLDGSAVTTINGDVNIFGGNSGFTLSGFTINGGVSIEEGAGNLVLKDLDISNPQGMGIEISGGWDYDEYWDEWYEYPHFGSVTLVDVRSDNNAGAGARIYSQGLIGVSNSIFNNNNWDGTDSDRLPDATPPDPIVALELRYWSGSVTLNGVIANENNGSGIVVDAGTVTIKNVIANDNTAPTYDWEIHDYITGGLGISVSSQNIGTNLLENITTDSNSNTGLDLYSWNGTFTLKNIQANFNQGNGIWIYASNGSASLTNIETVENQSSGLYAMVKNAITINDVYSDSNDWDGLSISGVEFGYWDYVLEEWVSTGYANPAVTIYNTVTPSWPVHIMNNGGSGISIDTRGAVSITNVYIEGNDGIGIKVDNCHYDPELDDEVCTGSGAVTIKSIIPGVRNWINNNGAGIYITSVTGNILIEKSNVENSQDGDGIYVSALGTITLNQVSSRSNEGSGAYLVNSAAVSAKLVTVQDTSAVPDSFFDDNGASGLFIRSKGAILINGVNASNNEDGSGADLDNCLESGGICAGSGSITIKHITPFTADFNGNSEYGIQALSKGSITLQNINADDNGLAGAVLRNNFTGSVGTVSVTASTGLENNFSGNHWNTEHPDFSDDSLPKDGLIVFSFGNITVKNVQAHSNQYLGAGIVLDNHEASSARTVLVQDSYTGENGSYGLVIHSKGSITLKQIGAWDNGWDGAWLNNTFGTAGNVTLTSNTGLWSFFNGNNKNDYPDSTGLRIDTNGNVILTSYEVNDNQNFDLPGLVISNENTLLPRTVTLTNGDTSGNWGGGMWVYSRGLITLRGIRCESNLRDGAWLVNNYPGATAGVSIASSSLKANAFSDNDGPGLTVWSNGAVAFSNVTANWNNLTERGIGNGQTIQEYYNEDSGSDKWWFYADGATRIDLSGSVENEFDFDPYLSLFDESDTIIAQDDDSGGGVSGLDSLINLTLEEGWYYVLVESIAGNNGLYNLSINDQTWSNRSEIWTVGGNIWSQSSITASGKNEFNGNSYIGLGATANGNINTSGSMYAFWNGNTGILLQNDSGYGNITMGGVTIANNNVWRGVDIATNGITLVSDLEVQFNDADGLWIEGNGYLKGVTLNRITAQYNGVDGIWIDAIGKLTLLNVKSWFNVGSGGYLLSNNNPVSISYSSFMSNGEHGAEVIHGSGLFTNLGSIYLGNDNLNLYHY